MAVGCGASFAKFMLILFNFIFWLSGVAVLGVGIWIKVDPSVINYQKLIALDANDSSMDTVSWVLIGVGGFVFLVSFIGFCGAMKESKCLLGSYIALLLFVICCEVTAGILAAVYQEKVEIELIRHLKKSIRVNFTNENIQQSWNFVQVQFDCCGVDGPQDFRNSTWFTSGAAGLHNVPDSCCVLVEKDVENMIPRNTRKCQEDAVSIWRGGPFKPDLIDVHSKGCYQSLTDWISDHIVILAIVGSGVGLMEILGLIFAICLCRNAEQEEEEDF